jgi:O-antigen/teichoic acid export membrane protein
VQTAANKVTIRPMFAAIVFGFLALLLGFLAAVILAQFQPAERGALGALSILTPCIPLLYFAFRGFRANRRDAFEALPQRACALAAASFAALGFMFGWFGGTWGLAAGPIAAAVAFALCVKPLREFVFELGFLLP